MSGGLSSMVGSVNAGEEQPLLDMEADPTLMHEAELASIEEPGESHATV